MSEIGSVCAEPALRGNGSVSDWAQKNSSVLAREIILGVDRKTWKYRKRRRGKRGREREKS